MAHPNDMSDRLPTGTNSFPSPFPPHIRTLGVVAISGIPDRTRLRRGIRRLASWNLEVVDRTGTLKPERFLAASDKDRLQALNELIDDERIDAVVAARGGYGAARLLPAIDWERLRRRNLPFIGYSDCTALHVAAFAHGCTRHIFGPMVSGDFARIPADEGEANDLAAVLASLRTAFEPAPETPVCGIPLKPLHSGRATGPLIPANLAVLTSLLGTPFFPDLSGCILVLEDINEAAYRIDRCLNQLDQAGVLPRLAGILFAQFTDCEDDHWLPEVLDCTAAAINGPVAAGMPFGHAFPSISLPVGTPVTLTVHPASVSLDWAARA